MESLKQICITGCGSSGTKYITKVFNRMGLQVGHEKISIHGMASWYVAVGSNHERIIYSERDERYNPNHTYNTHPCYDDFFSPPITLHQVRHPLKTISTLQRMRIYGMYWRYIRKHLPQIKYEEPRILQCMKYWLYWNEMAEKLAEWTYLVEELPTKKIFAEFCDRIEYPDAFKNRLDILNTSTKEHSKEGFYRPLSWDDLYNQDKDLTERIKEKGREYGYNI